MVRLWLLVLLLPLLCSSSQLSVTFHSPLIDTPVEGRTLFIDVEVHDYAVPEDGKGILYLDGVKLYEVRQQRLSISMDGAGGLQEGAHTLRLDIHPAGGGPVVQGAPHVFSKQGSPDGLEGPFHDDRFDGPDLAEMQEACEAYAESQRGGKGEQRGGSGGVIALGMPVVSTKTKYDGEEEDDMRVQLAREGHFGEAEEHPLMTVFVPSFLEQITRERGNYSYEVWLGFDLGDPLFDDPSARARLTATLSRRAEGLPVSFHWVRYEGMEGRVFWIYNDLFRQAYEQGADYFYMVNDDLRLATAGWADRFVEALSSSPIAPNFGVTGPLDLRDRHKHHMCFAFHHRTHYEVFGWFYPPAFQNWWSDYWATLVFGPEATFWLRDVHVQNTEVEPPLNSPGGAARPRGWARRRRVSEGVVGAC